jgi:RNA 2',3'-cyclic 3'-phosphodiesterase
MPRLFFGIRTSEEQRNELRSIQKELELELAEVGANFKLENMQNSHCTLRFLGDVDDSDVKQLIGYARQKIAKAEIKPFELTLDKCGAFASRGKARVIWAGLVTAPELLTLRNAIDGALNECGIVVDSDQEFHPHLTLVRFKEPFRLPAEFKLPEVMPVSSHVTEIELVESRTLLTGALHQLIARFEL